MARGNGASVELVKARHDVELAREELKHRMRVAGEAGTRLVRRVAGGAKPAIALLAGLGALALAVGLYKLVRGRPRPNVWRAPRRRSLIGEVVRSALISAAARLTAVAVARVSVPRLNAENAPPESR